jgi:hypothetical protein
MQVTNCEFNIHRSQDDNACIDHLLITLYVWRHSSRVNEALLMGYKVPFPKKSKTLEHVNVGGEWKIHECYV